MNAILHCLRKNCFVEESDDSNDDNSHATPRHLQLDRDSSFAHYEPPHPSHSIDSADNLDDHLDSGEFDIDLGLQQSNFDDDFGHDRDGEGEARGGEARGGEARGGEGGDNEQSNRGIRSIVNFLQQMGQTIGTTTTTTNHHHHNGHIKIPHSEEEVSEIENDYFIQDASPLREAKSSFAASDGNNNIPTIALSEVVIPGSQLQKKMSQSLKSQGYGGESEEDECVICMEGFDDTNPRMPTLCGCGANNTYFHLPCLYHWIEQSRDCPSCRKKLTWQEF
jgi:hypothetical protein